MTTTTSTTSPMTTTTPAATPLASKIGITLHYNPRDAVPGDPQARAEWLVKHGVMPPKAALFVEMTPQGWVEAGATLEADGTPVLPGEGLRNYALPRKPALRDVLVNTTLEIVRQTGQIPATLPPAALALALRADEDALLRVVAEKGAQCLLNRYSQPESGLPPRVLAMAEAEAARVKAEKEAEKAAAQAAIDDYIATVARTTPRVLLFNNAVASYLTAVRRIDGSWCVQPTNVTPRDGDYSRRVPDEVREEVQAVRDADLAAASSAQREADEKLATAILALGGDAAQRIIDGRASGEGHPVMGYLPPDDATAALASHAIPLPRYKKIPNSSVPHDGGHCDIPEYGTTVDEDNEVRLTAAEAAKVRDMRARVLKGLPEGVTLVSTHARLHRVWCEGTGCGEVRKPGLLVVVKLNGLRLTAEIE